MMIFKTHTTEEVRGNQKGFTLIEIMIVISMLALLAAIAFPSYRSYMIKNQQSDAAKNIHKLSGELEKWRSRSLSYYGFVPKNGYTDSTAATVETDVYTITIRSFSKSGSAYSTGLMTNTAGTANNWIMTAVPLNDSAGLLSYAMASNGLQCASPKAEDMVMNSILTNSKCGLQSEVW